MPLMGARIMGVTDSKLVFTKCRLLELQKRSPELQKWSNDNQTETPLAYSDTMVRDCYFVDLNVTGSVEGTSDKPKFALRSLFEKTVFPRISDLVKSGGEYAGYVPVIQGDNTGPHQDGDFVRFCKTYCVDNGWHWQPQAPQMPYMNNLDLAVLPSMSWRHNVLLRQSTTNTVQPNMIWRAV
jgi:hypothetical protein